MANKDTCIIVDSNCMIKNNEIENVFMVPLSIIETNNKVETVYKDLVDVTAVDIIKKAATNVDLKTSQTSLGEMLELFEQLTPKYKRIFVIPISKGISASYQTWFTAKSEYANHDINIIDAGDIAGGLKDVVLHIKKMIDDNKTTQEILDYVENHRSKRLAMLVATDLSRLIKGGRIGKVKGWIASKLGYNIMIKFDGKLEFYDKNRNLDETIDLTLKAIDETIHYKTNGIDKAYFYTSFLDEATNKELKNKIDQKLGFTTSIDYVPGVISVHTGAKTFAVYIVSK